MSSGDDHISQLHVGYALNEIAHPIGMQTNREVYGGNRGNTARNLAAIDGYRSARACHRPFDSPSSITRGEIHRVLVFLDGLTRLLASLACRRINWQLYTASSMQTFDLKRYRDLLLVSSVLLYSVLAALNIVQKGSVNCK